MNPVVNNFTVKVATVNGSGSQTANHVFLKCFSKMNIPVGSKNFFPSNIQGMATWFTIRVNEKGYAGATDHTDILANLNPKTLLEDIKSLASGGLLFYDQEAGGPGSLGRQDMMVFPIPFKKLVEELEVAPKYKKFASNMIYVGVLTSYLDIPENTLTAVL